MHHPFATSPRRPAIAGALLVLFAALSLAPAQAQQPLLAYHAIAPLIDNEGRPLASDPRAVPHDAAAHTRLGLYATADQARQLEQVLGARMRSVAVGCCGDDGADSAALRARDAGDLPVLVRGADLRQAARVANRLSDAGLQRVWLVTAPAGAGMQAAR
jgi:hypothetical protein